MFFLAASAEPDKLFLIEPYLQLGKQGGPGKLAILWAASDDAATAYQMQWKLSKSTNWSARIQPTESMITHGSSAIRLSTVELSGLPVDQKVDYRVVDDKDTLFQSTAHLPGKAANTYNFAVFGDCAWAGQDEKNVARRVYEDGTDLVVVTGDIVYRHGRISEYLAHFFPVYNGTVDSAGSPLIRSTLMVAAPGNHDLYNGSFGVSGDLHRFPDGLAYFLFWDQPLNGPDVAGDEKGNTPLSAGTRARAEFLAGSGNRYPNMASFSFDYGNAHWTVIDSNPYANWQTGKRAQWLEADLKAAAKSKWRFVAFHHPPFHSGRSHAGEQHMRHIVSILEKYNVDVVFNGHVHNYQRTYPLKFVPGSKQPLDFLSSEVRGTYKPDTGFDGVKDTTPIGPIYIVTGCGGAPLAVEHELLSPRNRDVFTAQYAAVHSYTRCEVKGNSVLIRQIATDGTEVDRIKITK